MGNTAVMFGLELSGPSQQLLDCGLRDSGDVQQILGRRKCAGQRSCHTLMQPLCKQPLMGRRLNRVAIENLRQYFEQTIDLLLTDDQRWDKTKDMVTWCVDQ